MLIKTKLYVSTAVLLFGLVATALIAMLTFNQLSTKFQSIVGLAKESAVTAEHVSEGATASSSSLTQINTNMLNIVDGIAAANQQNQLVGKKISEISGTLSELVETIEELSEDVADEEALAILEEISDEVGDVSERLKREGLISINRSVDTLGEFGEEIQQEASKVSVLNEAMGSQLEDSKQSKENSENILQMVFDADSAVDWEKALITSLLGTLAFVTLLFALAMFKWVVKPINDTVTLMDSIGRGEGDLTQRLKIKSKDEMAMIASSFNHFVSRIQVLLREANNSMEELKGSAAQTLEAMKTGEQEMLNQKNEVEKITAAVSQLSASSHSVATSATDADSSVSSVNESCQSGKHVVDNTVTAVSKLAGEVQNTVGVITSLSEKSESIASVMDVIQQISEQTNLLALNAAIEAARAGEHGRGFAVVADEVRALASKAESSTTDIRQIVGEIQTLVNQVVEVMQASHSESESAINEAKAASEALQEIEATMDIVTNANNQITQAARDQQDISEHVAQSIERVNEMANSTTARLSTTVSSCAGLNGIADALMGQLRQFKV